MTHTSTLRTDGRRARAGFGADCRITRLPPVHAARPTSGASASLLSAQLRECRARLLRLTQDLTDAQFIGPRLDIVNPFLWEIGHIGWFHEYWTLRGAHGRPPMIERG